MKDATDQDLKAMGWRWALRLHGRLMAVTVLASDAARWAEEEGAGSVVALDHVEQEPRP